MDAKERLEDFKAKAEISYGLMYDCRPHELKDYKDDASLYYSQALEAARELGLADETAELEKKMAELMAIYRQLSF
jgi:hypothetical protein